MFVTWKIALVGEDELEAGKAVAGQEGVWSFVKDSSPAACVLSGG